MYLKPKQITVHAGLEHPVRILHLTDPHLSLANEQDAEQMKEKTAARRDVFFREAGFPERDPVGFLEEGIAYGARFDATVITGDVLDRITFGNLEAARGILAGKDYLFCPGNHEFVRAEYPELFSLKAEKRALLQTVFPGNLNFESRIAGGVNLIAADNSYYLWSEEQFELLKKEVSRGLPILLFCHSPLEDPMRTMQPGSTRRVDVITAFVRQAGATDEMIKTSCRVVDYIAREPLIKATFAGHFHGTFEIPFGDKTTYILGGLFKGIVGEILVD